MVEQYLATESKVMMYGEITFIANNAATEGSGGCISLQQSDLQTVSSSAMML